MSVKVRKIQKEDRGVVKDMMKIFYSSNAVSSNGSEEIFERDIQNCIDQSPYLEGYVFEQENKVIGYAMVAKSFSTEWGKECVWLEDIFILQEFRGKKIAKQFLNFLDEAYPTALKRLEVEDYNQNAVKAYESSGYEFVPYKQMWKDFK